MTGIQVWSSKGIRSVGKRLNWSEELCVRRQSKGCYLTTVEFKVVIRVPCAVETYI